MYVRVMTADLPHQYSIIAVSCILVVPHIPTRQNICIVRVVPVICLLSRWKSCFTTRHRHTSFDYITTMLYMYGCVPRPALVAFTLATKLLFHTVELKCTGGVTCLTQTGVISPV